MSDNHRDDRGHPSDFWQQRAGVTDRVDILHLVGVHAHKSRHFDFPLVLGVVNKVALCKLACEVDQQRETRWKRNTGTQVYDWQQKFLACSEQRRHTLIGANVGQLAIRAALKLEGQAHKRFVQIDTVQDNLEKASRKPRDQAGVDRDRIEAEPHTGSSCLSTFRALFSISSGAGR